MADKIWRIIDLINLGEQWFAEKGVNDSRLNIELLLCHVLDYQRIDLYTKFDQPLNKNELDKLRDLVKQRASRKPLQYIIGEVEFYGLNLKCDERALIPRPETEYLIDIIKRNVNKAHKILDIGTGSACIPLALSRIFPEAEIISIDISQEAIDLANENKISNQIDNVSFLQMNILEEFPKGKFDLIVSNPPYVSTEDYDLLEPELKEHEPSIALTDNLDGLTFYKRFAQIFPEILHDDGVVFLEHGDDQEVEIVELFNVINKEIEKLKDLNGKFRYLKL